MELGVTTEQWGVRDQRWLGSSHGTDAPEPVMLDLTHTSWVPATHWPTGTLLSGLALKKVTGSQGRYRAFKTTAPELDTQADCFLLSGGQKVPSPLNDDVAVDVLRHGRVRLSYLPMQAAPYVITAAQLPTGITATLEP
jgi:hypothetical protein